MYENRVLTNVRLIFPYLRHIEDIVLHSADNRAKSLVTLGRTCIKQIDESHHCEISSGGFKTCNVGNIIESCIVPEI